MKKGIALGLIFLLIMMSFTSISGIQINNQVVKPFGRGGILYVGGNGPGNYSTIQSAINDSNNGDTVYVLNDSSPYIEQIIIDKSISLIGENRNTTIIDGFKEDNTIYVLDNANEVTITGFTIIKSEVKLYSAINIYSNYNNIKNNNIVDHAGIRVEDSIGNNISSNMLVADEWGLMITNSNENNITDNYIISEDSSGIQLKDSFNNIVSHNKVVGGNSGIYIRGGNNHIFGNIIKDKKSRCLTIDGSNNSVYKNNISNSNCGIEIRSPKNNDIYYNDIKSCYTGVTLTGAENNNIHRNNIFECNLGLFYSYYSIKNRIYENNFIDNKIHGSWIVFLFEIPSKNLRNIWDGNYWGEPLLFPKLIKGYIVRNAPWYPYIGLFSSYRIDWHPAMEPYDIPSIQGCGIE
jgi:parallel beta-helix repeat protein